MPGLPYQNLPAEQVNQIRGQIQAQWQIEANALARTPFADRGKFEAANAKLSAKYDMMELKSMQALQQQAQEQQQEQAKREQLLGLARQRREGELSPEQLTQQRLGMTAGQWGATAPERGLSFTQMESPSLRESVARYIDSAPSRTGWLHRMMPGPPDKIKKGLIDAYNGWKDWVDYDEQNYAVKEDLDKIWDTEMYSRPECNTWWENEKDRTVPKEVQRARHRGGKWAEAGKNAMAGKSPFARSIKKPSTAPIGMPQQRVLTATNPQTGQKITSRDGGRSWQ